MEWEWWSDINTYRLFTYMLLKANWKDGKFKGIDIPRGSLVSSISKLSSETNLTVDEVRTALKHLKSTNEITSKSHSKFTIFTVSNYGLYQDSPEQLTKQPPSEPHPVPELLPSEPHPIPELLPTIEEKKEREEGKQEKKERREEGITPPLSPTRGKSDPRGKPRRETQKQLLSRLRPETDMSDYLLGHINNWLEYKKERRFTYQERGLKTLLKQASEHAKRYGDEAVAKVISSSIASGYQGIVWDRLQSQPLNRKDDINASRQSQLEYLLSSIKEDEASDGNGC